jgi:hypothetical protein
MSLTSPSAQFASSLLQEVKWPSESERAATRTKLVNVGILEPGFEDLDYTVDATKDLARRARIYAVQVRLGRALPWLPQAL